jgi:hypothetical protein
MGSKVLNEDGHFGLGCTSLPDSVDGPLRLLIESNATLPRRTYCVVVPEKRNKIKITGRAVNWQR